MARAQKLTKWQERWLFALDSAADIDWTDESTSDTFLDIKNALLQAFKYDAPLPPRVPIKENKPA